MVLRAASIVIGMLAVLCASACGGGNRSVMPPAPPPGAAPAPLTVDGFPVTLSEFPLPADQELYNNIVIGPDGAVWVSARSLVQTQDGVPVTTLDRITGNGTVTEFADPRFLNETTALLTVRHDLWFTAELNRGTGFDFANVIVRRSLTGAITTFPLPPHTGVVSMTPGVNDDFWMTILHLVGSETLGHLAADGTLSELPLPQGDCNGCFFNSIVLGPDKNLYVAAITGAAPVRVFRISTTGTPLGSIDLATSTFIAAVLAGPDNAVWINAWDDVGKIVRMTPSGVLTEFPLPPIPNPDFFHPANPLGLVFSGGVLWVSDAADSRIFRLTPSGQLTDLALPVFMGPLAACPQACENAHVRLWSIGTANVHPAPPELIRFEY